MNEQEQQYRKLLARHDWYYNFSDDHGVWTAGRENISSIFKMQPDVDPSFKIWDEYAPEDFKRTK